MLIEIINRIFSLRYEYELIMPNADWLAIRMRVGLNTNPRLYISLRSHFGLGNSPLISRV